MTENELPPPETIPVHTTTISLVKAPAAEIDASSDMTFKLKVTCDLGCDLQGYPVKILDHNAAVVKEIELVSTADTLNETGEFSVQSPNAPGEYTWTAVFPSPPPDEMIPAEKSKAPHGNEPSPATDAEEHLGEIIVHGESTVSFTFVVKAHATSMAIWDIQSPVALGAQFKIKVGAMCLAGCKVNGNPVQVYDDQDKLVATATLSDEPWSAAGPLFWTEITLQAPSTAGYREWNVKFGEPKLDLRHTGTAYPFAFVTAAPPDHVVTIQAIDKDNKTALANADVTMFAKDSVPYRTRTNASGVAKLNVPKGNYTVAVLPFDYKDWKTTADVNSDLTLTAEIEYHPDTGA